MLIAAETMSGSFLERCEMAVLRTIQSYENPTEDIAWNNFPFPLQSGYPRFNLSCGHSVPAKEVSSNVSECPKCTETVEEEQSRLVAFAVALSRFF